MRDSNSKQEIKKKKNFIFFTYSPTPRPTKSDIPKKNTQ